MMLFYIVVFILSFAALAWSSKRLIRTLSKLAKFLGWKEFVVAFFTMALAGTLPNLSVGISSALHAIPELSLAEIIGGNIVDLTLAVALAAMFTAGGLALPSRVVQGSAIFTLIIAVLPLCLTLDKVLSRGDGLLLILVFTGYIAWLFNRDDRFRKVYDSVQEPLGLLGVCRTFFTFLASIALMLLAAEGIVASVIFFSQALGLPLILIGIILVGLGNALPEIFFSIQAARQGNSWMVVGDLMGAVILPATLVLGVVALIHPIYIDRLSFFSVGRVFLIIAAVFFLIFVRTDKKITKKEAILLLSIYLAFVITEALII